ncbi:hypothetical protein ACFWP5_39260 [Streptomyces sp. NPDC058469]|uniref:hypothetical protein n=1 Tax=Streptomyces sp. NPDC058469 TaxID=3346514 RepID=UPI00365C5C3E
MRRREPGRLRDDRATQVGRRVTAIVDAVGAEPPLTAEQFAVLAEQCRQRDVSV